LEEKIDLYTIFSFLINSGMIIVWNVTGEEKFITYPAQQLQMQNGEHKSFSLSGECFSWFEVNSV
jgi:hypothetical protein